MLLPPLLAFSAAVVDLALPFPRPTARQAVEQLALAVEAQEAEGGPTDMLDVYGGRSEWLADFEAEIAASLGKERALFLPTGVAAQNAALATHARLPFRNYRNEPPPCFVMHATSHLNLYEEAAYSELLGLGVLLAGDAQRCLSAADVGLHLRRLAAVGSAPCMILVELPMRELGCETVAGNGPHPHSHPHPHPHPHPNMIPSYR
jgi:threonine aldolase